MQIALIFLDSCEMSVTMVAYHFNDTLLFTHDGWITLVASSMDKGGSWVDLGMVRGRRLGAGCGMGRETIGVG
jgi:hypothetical protein